MWGLWTIKLDNECGINQNLTEAVCCDVVHLGSKLLSCRHFLKHHCIICGYNSKSLCVLDFLIFYTMF